MINILIVAPHVDDEVIGCGGLIAKSTKAGSKVYVVIVTNGNLGAPELFPLEGTLKVRSEALKAHKFLGVEKTFFLDFPAPRLDTVPAYKISLAIKELIFKYDINSLYIPHRGDIHKDHGIVFLASLVAARPIYDCPVKNIYAYETLSETEWAPPYGDDAFIPTEFVDISEEMEMKLKAFSFFETQLREFPHSRSLEAIEALAKLRGSTVGKLRSEAFSVIRRIVD